MATLSSPPSSPPASAPAPIPPPGESPPARHAYAEAPVLREISRYYRLVRWGVAVTVTALVGAAAGLTMPRFPASSAPALLVMVLGLAVGLGTGLAWRSRWAMLVAPVLAAASFHVGRLAAGVHGPTIDGIHLDTTYGLVAFGLGFLVPGQMVSQLETDRRLYRDVLALATRTGNEALARKMRAYGEPPYGDVFAQALVMEQYDALYQPYEPPQAYIERGTAANLGPWGIFGSEYSVIDKLNVLRGALEMNSAVYPQLEAGQGLDFRRDVPRLEVPSYMLDGQAELTARRELALEWNAQLQAPIKRVYSFDNAAHSVPMEQFEAFHRILLETILPETYPPPAARG